MTLLLKKKRPPKFLPNAGLALPSSTLWIGALNAMSARASALRREVRRLNSLQIQLRGAGSARARRNPFLRNRNLPEQQFYTPPNQPIVIYKADQDEKAKTEAKVERLKTRAELADHFKNETAKYYRDRAAAERRNHDSTMADADSSAGAASRARVPGVPGPSAPMPDRQGSDEDSTTTRPAAGDGQPAPVPVRGDAAAPDPDGPPAAQQDAHGTVRDEFPRDGPAVDPRQEAQNTIRNAGQPQPMQLGEALAQQAGGNQADVLADGGGGEAAPPAGPSARTQIVTAAVNPDYPVGSRAEPLPRAFDQGVSTLGAAQRQRAESIASDVGSTGGGLAVNAAHGAQMAMNIDDYAFSAEGGPPRARRARSPTRRRTSIDAPYGLGAVWRDAVDDAGKARGRLRGDLRRFKAGTADVPDARDPLFDAPAAHVGRVGNGVNLGSVRGPKRDRAHAFPRRTRMRA